MRNNIENQYLKLLKDILENGVEKKDRTGTGTISVFGRQVRHDMKLGFPLLTTKKMYFRGIVTELLWFLRGDTNIKFLIDNDCHIWDGDVYKAYETKIQSDCSTDNPKYKDGFDCTYLPVTGTVLEEVGSKYSLYAEPFKIDEFISKIKTDDVFSKRWGDLGPIYGKQWRSWSRKTTRDEKIINPGVYEAQIDQIQNLINDLKTNPDSRRLMVSAWNVGELDQMVLPPCHYSFQVYTRELSREERIHIYVNQYMGGVGKPAGFEDAKLTTRNIPTRAISLMWNQRSVDTFLGLPFNIASYGLLLEIIAVSVNMVPDELVGNLGDVHLYSNHIEQAKEQIVREQYPLPKFNINTEWWPHEGGECGVGPIDAVKVFESFKDDNFCKSLLEEDLQLYDYQSHPAIKAPLSN